MTQPNETYDRILRCARDLYLEGGLKGVTMRRVATCADLTATAIYRHFENKEKLLISVLDEAFRTFSRYLWTSLSGETPLDRFRSAGEAYLRFALEQPQYYKVIFMTPSEQLGFKDLPEASREQFGRTFHFLVDRIRECMDEHLLKPGDPEAVATTMWTHSHGLCSLYISGQIQGCGDQEGFEELYWRSLSHLLEGLGTEEYPSRVNAVNSDR